MGNPYPAFFTNPVDLTRIRIDGQITFSDPNNQPGGGGGAVNSVTAGDSSITIGGTAPDPTVAVASLGITAAKLAALAVTTAKIANLAVTAAQIANATITDVQVAAANIDGVAATPSLRTLGTGAQQACGGADSRLSDSRTPTGTAGGDLTGTYPNPTIGAGKVVTASIANAAVGLTQLSITPILSGGAAGGSLSGTYPNPSIALSTIDATLGGNVTMTTAGTWYDGPSASFAAGTWLVIWRMLFTDSVNQSDAYNVKLWDGTTVYDESESDFGFSNGGGDEPMNGHAIVVLGSPATLKISGNSARNGTLILRDVTNNSATSHKATRLSGVKVA